MVGIVRNASITFDNKKELREFEKRINEQSPRVSIENLLKKVKADGIIITRGNEMYEEKIYCHSA